MKTIKSILVIFLVSFSAISCTKETIVTAVPSQPQTSISIEVGFISAAIVDSVSLDGIVYSTGFPVKAGGIVTLPTNGTATQTKVTVYLRAVANQEIIYTDANGITTVSNFTEDNSGNEVISSLGLNIGFGNIHPSVHIETIIQ